MSAKIVSLPVVIHAQSDCSKQLAERFLDDAIKTVEKRFRDDLEMLHLKPEHYAARHPEIVAALIQSQAIVFASMSVTTAVVNFSEAMEEKCSEVLSVAESMDVALPGIEKSLDDICAAIRSLDKA